MQATRKPDETSPLDLDPGDYAKRKGQWFLRLPNGLLATVNDKWSVVEHSDGAITVNPSIRTWTEDSEWHGFLEHGVWREC